MKDSETPVMNLAIIDDWDNGPSFSLMEIFICNAFCSMMREARASEHSLKNLEEFVKMHTLAEILPAHPRRQAYCFGGAHFPLAHPH